MRDIWNELELPAMNDPQKMGYSASQSPNEAQKEPKQHRNLFWWSRVAYYSLFWYNIGYPGYTDLSGIKEFERD